LAILKLLNHGLIIRMPEITNEAIRKYEEQLKIESNSKLYATAAGISQYIRKKSIHLKDFTESCLPMLLSAICDANTPKMLSPALGFTYAGLGLIVGTQQLLDTTTHRPNATKLKGLMTSLGSVQAVTILALGLICPPSFAASMAVMFSISLDELALNTRKLNPYYWIKDTSAQINKLESRINDLDKIINDLNSEKGTIKMNSPDAKRIEDQMNIFNNKKNELTETKKKLETDMTIQIKTLIIQKKPVPHCIKADTLIKLEQEVNTLDESGKKNLLNQQIAIQKKCNAACDNAALNTLISGMSLTGAILLCIPGFQAAGLGLLAAASLAFFAKTTINFVNNNLQAKEAVKSALSNWEPNKKTDESPPIDASLESDLKIKNPSS